MSESNIFISFPSEDHVSLTVGETEIDFRTGKATLPDKSVKDLGNRISKDKVLKSVLFSATGDINVEIFDGDDTPYQGLVPAGMFKLSDIQFDLIRITTTATVSLFLVASTDPNSAFMSLMIDLANTARTTSTMVLPVQGIDATGKVSPAGDAVGNAPFVKLTDGTSTITSFGGLGQSDIRGIYIIGTDKGTYTVNNGTWPIDYTGFTGLTLDNFPHKIVNLTTGEAYSMVNATISSTQITPSAAENVGLTEPATGDVLFIPVVQDVRAYDDSLDLTKIAEQAPMDQQVLDEILLSAVTAAGPSSDVYVLDKKQLTVCIVASAISGAGSIFTFQGSPDQSNYGAVGSVNNVASVNSTQTIGANGTYIFEIVNASSLKWFRVNLTTRTDGTFTVYLFARS